MRKLFTLTGDPCRRCTAGPSGPSIIIFVLNNCEDNPTLQITASGLPEGGDSFNVQSWNGSGWDNMTPAPITVVNGYSEVDLGDIIYVEAELRMINVAETILSNQYTIVPCPPSITFGNAYVCQDKKVQLSIAYNGIPDGYHILFQYFIDGNWETLGATIITDGSGDQDNLSSPDSIEIPNGVYPARAIALEDESIVDEDPLGVSCESPSVEITGADYNCGDDNLVVDFTLTSIHANENIIFRIGLASPAPTHYQWPESNVVPGSTFTFSTVVPPLSNATYYVIAEITDINGTHSSEPFEIIINCP